MTRHYYVNGVALADSTTLIKGRSDGLDSAADGTVASAIVIVRDPQGAQLFKPWCEFAVEDDACSSPRSWTGYLANMDISRGEYAIGVTTGSPRSWAFELFDLNSLLRRQVLREHAINNRPRESGSARAAWLLGSEALAGLIYDNGRVETNPWMYDEADYRGKYADDVLADISVNSIDDELGALSFVYWDDTAPAGHEKSLFYNHPTATVGTSTISLSNVDADVDNVTCFWAHPEPVLTRAGEDIYCGVYFTTRDGSIYRHNATTHANYFADTDIHRDGTFSTDRISLGPTAEDHAQMWLNNHKGSVDTLKLTARLTPAVVNLLNAGMRVQVRLPHLPGLATASYRRVRRRTLPIEEGKRAWYDVPLELSMKGVPQSGGGNPSGFPARPPDVAACTTPGDPDADNVTDGITPTLDVLSGLTPGVTGSLSDMTATSPGASVSAIVGAGGYPSPGTPYFFQYDVDLGSAKHIAYALVSDIVNGGGGGANANYIGSSHGGCELYWSDDGAAWTKVVAVGSWTEIDLVNHEFQSPSLNGIAHRYWGWRFLEWFGSPSPYTGGFWGGCTTHGFRLVECLDFTEPLPPTQGQWQGINPPELATMVGANGSTAFPFADHSLRVFYDIVEQTAAIVSYDGGAGTFVMPSAPPLGTQVFVQYQGRG